MPIMFVQSFRVCILCVLSLTVSNDAARILAVFPVPSISHQVVFRPLTQELARRGHELVIITPDPAFPKGQTPKNITEMDFHDVSYEMWVERFVKKIQGDTDDSFTIIKAGFNGMSDVFEQQMLSTQVQDLIKSKPHFDLIFTEACVRPAIVMSYVFKAPLIQISSFGAVPPNYQVMGAPSHPVYSPELTRKRIYDLTLWEKIQGAYEDILFRHMLWSTEARDDEINRRVFGPDTPTIKELSDNVEMLFLNINPIWENNRPVPPGVIYLGGLHQKPEQELPNELKSYLDKSEHGVIYMSFGTNVHPSQLPPERIQIFINVFSKLPYDVLWKWDKDELIGRPKNVRISKWLPQSDLLRHPKIKLFITQAGLQSTDESLTAGVPLIAFPMLGDQWYNAEKYVQLEIGMKFDIETVNEEVLTAAIQNVINDQRYRRNMKRLGTLMRDRPQSPLERAVWWTEHVIRHGGAKHLRSAAANSSWTEYLMLDVLAVIAGVVTVTAAFFALIVCSAFKCTRQGKKIKTK